MIDNTDMATVFLLCLVIGLAVGITIGLSLPERPSYQEVLDAASVVWQVERVVKYDDSDGKSVEVYISDTQNTKVRLDVVKKHPDFEAYCNLQVGEKVRFHPVEKEVKGVRNNYSPFDYLAINR